MKLNLSKSTEIPLGAACEDDPPVKFPFKYLPSDEEECLLGVPVSRILDPNSTWHLMISKLAESIKHWSAQRLSIFGRIHAARSYIGCNSWYLATMIPPQSKSLKRLTSNIWRFLSNNKNFGRPRSVQSILFPVAKKCSHPTLSCRRSPCSRLRVTTICYSCKMEF
jgi:hypothetical protein